MVRLFFNLREEFLERKRMYRMAQKSTLKTIDSFVLNGIFPGLNASLGLHLLYKNNFIITIKQKIRTQ